MRIIRNLKVLNGLRGLRDIRSPRVDAKCRSDTRLTLDGAAATAGIRRGSARAATRLQTRNRPASGKWLLQLGAATHTRGPIVCQYLDLSVRIAPEGLKVWAEGSTIAKWSSVDNCGRGHGRGAKQTAA